MNFVVLALLRGCPGCAQQIAASKRCVFEVRLPPTEVQGVRRKLLTWNGAFLEVLALFRGYTGCAHQIADSERCVFRIARQIADS